jgi:hypothetical protein
LKKMRLRKFHLGTHTSYIGVMIRHG